MKAEKEREIINTNKWRESWQDGIASEKSNWTDFYRKHFSPWLKKKTFQRKRPKFWKNKKLSLKLIDVQIVVLKDSGLWLKSIIIRNKLTKNDKILINWLITKLVQKKMHWETHNLITNNIISQYDNIITFEQF